VYGSSKLEAEKLAWAGYHEHDLPVVIIRPTIVYGPASQYWTIYPVQRLLAGGFYLIEDGQGVCNPVYVDDLVRALTLAATHPAAIGEAFFITSQPVTWRQFFGYYIQMAGVQQQVPSWDITTWNERHSEQNILKTPLGKAKSYLAADRPRWLAHKFLPTRVALRLFDKVAPGFKERVMSESNRLYRARRWPVTLPDEREMIQFSSRCVYSVKKAAELLNYEPVVSLDKGMTRTKDWLHYVGLLNA
jgi:nucleoside-diphosphate-sugar epimerase